MGQHFNNNQPAQHYTADEADEVLLILVCKIGNKFTRDDDICIIRWQCFTTMNGMKVKLMLKFQIHTFCEIQDVYNIHFYEYSYLSRNMRRLLAVINHFNRQCN